MSKSFFRFQSFSKLFTTLSLLLILPFFLHAQVNSAKPWAYWWWMGSAVNKADIKKNLEDFSAAGFGGMHIIPIYGVKGEEANFIPYLSPQWLAMLDYTCTEAKRLGLGIDMTLGTGWPFGGSQVKLQDAAQAFQVQRIDVKANEKITQLPAVPEKWKDAKLVAVSAYSYKAFIKKLDISKGISWEYPQESNLYALYQLPTGQKVKRAAPGAEGWVLDHFNATAIKTYFQTFAQVFMAKNYGVRAFYNDSYEVYGANWTSTFVQKFQQLRGYDLLTHLDVLAQDTAITDREKRIWADYHETISDVLLEDFTKPLMALGKQFGKIVRNEAHGAPANLLDLYAASDVPETEFFGSKPYGIPGYRVDPDYEVKRFGEPDAFVIKWAASAAHVAGRKMVSCETATWLGNHFKVALSQVKPIVDECLVSGVNHIFYHGVPYSPPAAEFPGWLFYASTNFNQQSHFWPFLPQLNAYIERSQSRLQAAKPDNDVLLYFPIYDVWHAAGRKGKTHPMEVHSMVHDIKDSPFGRTSAWMSAQGLAYDFVSDRQIQGLKVENGVLVSTGGTRYKSLVLPITEYIPLATIQALVRLKQAGASILFEARLPRSVNGWNNYDERQKTMQSLMANFQITLVRDLGAALSKAGVRREFLAEKGLSFIRKKTDKGTLYFISNLSGQFKEGRVRLASNAKMLKLYDPLNQQSGWEGFRTLGPNNIETFLQLAPGSSIFVEALDKADSTLTRWPLPFEEADVKDFTGPWKVEFVSGKPFVPKGYQADTLASWTEAPDTLAQYFSGTGRYSLSFSLPAFQVGKPARLDLGDVREMAKVSINGRDLGSVWSLPFVINVPEGVLQKENTIQIEVTNLSANRVRYLDRQKTPWKKFYDINIVDIRYQPFDASNWAPVPSGLKGPVKLMFQRL